MRYHGAQKVEGEMRKNDVFIKELRAGMAEIGANPAGDDFLGWHYDVETAAGKLSVTVPRDAWGSKSGKVYSVFSRFDDPERASALGLGNNPYSGKWNFHGFSRGLDPKLIAGAVVSRIKAVMEMRAA